MHESSMLKMKELLKIYGEFRSLAVLEVGSAVVVSGPYPTYAEGTDIIAGTYREFMRSQWNYTGLDMCHAPNVHIVTVDPYNWPIPDNRYDIVISGNCMEHVPEPLLWMREIFRVCKPQGAALVVAPSAGPYHKCPVHCWQIMPDGMEYVMRKTGFEILEIGLLDFHPFHDCWGAGRKP